MAGLSGVAVGDFALDADIREMACEGVADPEGQFADGPGLALGHEVEGELAHEARPVVRDARRLGTPLARCWKG